MKPNLHPPLWLSIFGLSSVLIITLSFIFLHLPKQSKNNTPSGASTTWQTYKNTKYNFEFQYDSNLKIVQNGKSTEFWYETEAPSTAIISIEPINLSYESLLKEYRSPTHNNAADALIKEYVINSNGLTIKVYDIAGGESDTFYAYIMGPKQNFLMNFFSSQEYADQILSTFRFSDPSEAPAKEDKFIEPIPSPTSTPGIKIIHTNNKTNKLTNSVFRYSFNFDSSLDTEYYETNTDTLELISSTKKTRIHIYHMNQLIEAPSFDQYESCVNPKTTYTVGTFQVKTFQPPLREDLFCEGLDSNNVYDTSFTHNATFFRIVMLTSPEEDLKSYFDQILSTFKFSN